MHDVDKRLDICELRPFTSIPVFCACHLSNIFFNTIFREEMFI